MSDTLHVHPALETALNERGYEILTPVQTAVIDPDLSGQDLLVSAQTGSGKTVAFGLALASTLLGENSKFAKPRAPLALVVAPTRELALQVKREFEWLYQRTGATVTSCVGGMDIRTERRALERGAHIVVGTPGRLRDHIMRNALDTTQLAGVVLDEADEMLDLGFREDLEFILEATPEERRTLLFSATVPPTIAKLAKNYQRDATRVTTAQEKEQHADIDYRALVVAPREAENAIINVLRYYEADNALVFCNTRAAVNRMVSRFNNRGFSVVALSGELTQSERTNALHAMRNGRARVCIATDVAARGIDLPNLELVIHADLPSNPETLLHRSGRTGRAGRKGVSALMVEPRSRSRAERLLRFAKINAEWSAPPSADNVIQRDNERMLTSAILTDPVVEDEKDSIDQLLAAFEPQQIAAAFLRQAHKGRSAPEDIQILDVNQPSREKFNDRKEKKPRDAFTDSVWVSLSVGRKQNAEPRWLIPMLCKTGGLTKRAIGAIKMQPNETYVQLDARKADEFFDDLGARGTLEKNIRVCKLDGEPDFSSSSRPTFKKPHRKGDDKPRRRESAPKDQPAPKQVSEKPKRDKKRWRDDPDKQHKLKKPHRGKGDASKPGKPKISKEESDAKAKAGWAKKKPKGRKKRRNTE